MEGKTTVEPTKAELTPRQHVVEAISKLKEKKEEKFGDAILHLETALYKLNNLAK